MNRRLGRGPVLLGGTGLLETGGAKSSRRALAHGEDELPPPVIQLGLYSKKGRQKDVQPPPVSGTPQPNTRSAPKDGVGWGKRKDKTREGHVP